MPAQVTRRIAATALLTAGLVLISGLTSAQPFTAGSPATSSAAGSTAGPAPAREDALAPTAAPDRAPEIAQYLNDWRSAKPRTEAGRLVFHDILTPLGGADPMHPARRGAVLSVITRVSHASLAPGANARFSMPRAAKGNSPSMARLIG